MSVSMKSVLSIAALSGSSIASAMSRKRFRKKKDMLIMPAGSQLSLGMSVSKRRKATTCLACVFAVNTSVVEREIQGELCTVSSGSSSAEAEYETL